MLSILFVMYIGDGHLKIIKDHQRMNSAFLNMGSLLNHSR